jgi:hypothetical protein
MAFVSFSTELMTASVKALYRSHSPAQISILINLQTPKICVDQDTADAFDLC